jgi:hypothetical protein
MREKYRWVPQAFRIIAWNATLLCALLDSRQVFLYGDSTIQQSAHGLMPLISEENAGTFYFF